MNKAMETNKEILVATTNSAKLVEIRRMLSAGGFSVLSLRDIDIHAQVDEDGGTFEANAIKKAVEIARMTGRTVLADDSGLCVDYLGGAPGVDSAFFMGEGTAYAVRNAKIIELLTCAEGAERAARFVCVMALARPDGDVISIRGEVEGQIAKAPAGDDGFGYDPIFFIPQFGKTMAQLSVDEKNKISHRGHALMKMVEAILASKS